MSTAVSSRLEQGVSSSSKGTPRSSRKAMLPYDEDSLPDIKNGEGVVDKTKPLPTSLQSDFIPEDILFALTQPPPAQDQLGPPSRFRNLNTSSAHSRKPPANVWNFPKRRDKLKHLTDSTPCACGAGKDISFLYDVPKKEKKGDRVGSHDQSSVRLTEETPTEEPPQRHLLKLPDTLVPEEYHIVKNRGVLGLEYHDEKYATQPNDHEKHLVVFPSLNPTSRYEVLQLKKAMDEMLRKAGVEEEEEEIRGLTAMHNLLELIKKEQDIYNIVFHELIRQVSVECMERGELLSDVRNRYSNILNKVPRQVKSLHEEVMAQRALDRRLTEELMRFKSTIGILTSELSEVKEHDALVTQEAQEAQEGLKAALAESQKNAALLSEYHDLYELQRGRLEAHVTMLAEEKELWETASYSLALKVSEEHSLTTAKRLHVSEKSWAKLANHFTILLSDKDTEVLTELQSYVEKWRDLVEKFHNEMVKRDAEMKVSIQQVKDGISKWIRDFQRNVLSKDGHLSKAPSGEMMKNLYGNMKEWEQVLAGEQEKFGGDILLTGQEDLTRVRRQMEGWTDCAMKVFGRHKTEDGGDYPDQDEMINVNEEIEELVRQMNIKLAGENGVATGIIHLSNALESWDNKFNAVIHGGNPIADNEWLRFYQLMEDWTSLLDETLLYVGTTQKEGDREELRPHTTVETSEVIRMTQRWLSSATNGIDSEDAKLVEQVSTLHTEMVKWMVQILLRLAPDRQGNSKEANQMALLGSTSIAKIKENATSLFKRLTQFSSYVGDCCHGIVVASVQLKVDNQEQNADHELRDLKRLYTESEDWVYTASLLLQELTGEPPSLAPPTNYKQQVAPPDVPPPTAAEEQEPEEEEVEKEGEEEVAVEAQEEKEEDVIKEDAEDTTQEGAETGAEETEKQEQDEEKDGDEEEKKKDAEMKMEIIGSDANTYFAALEQEPDQAPNDLGRPAPQHKRPETPDTKKAYEALAAVGSLQIQLLETETRAQEAEERASTAELELKEALQKLRAFERERASPSSPAAEQDDKEKKETRSESAQSQAASEKSTKSVGKSRTTSRSSVRGKKR